MKKMTIYCFDSVRDQRYTCGYRVSWKYGVPVWSHKIISQSITVDLDSGSYAWYCEKRNWGPLTVPHITAAILRRGQRVAYPQYHNMATCELTVRLFLWEPQLLALVLNEGSERGVKQNYGLFFFYFHLLHHVFYFVSGLGEMVDK